MLERSTLSASFSIAFLRLSETACLIVAPGLSPEEEISAEILVEVGTLSRVGISRIEVSDKKPLSLFWFNLPRSAKEAGKFLTILKLDDKVLQALEFNLSSLIGRFFSNKDYTAKFFEILFRVIVPRLGLLQHQGFSPLLQAFCDIHASGRVHSFQSHDLTRAILSVSGRSRQKTKCTAIALVGHETGVSRLANNLPLDSQVEPGILLAVDVSHQLAHAQFCILVLEDAIIVARLTAHVHASAKELLRNVSAPRPDVAAALYREADRAERRQIDRAAASLSNRASVSVAVPNQFRFELETAVSLDGGLFLAGWFVDPEKIIKTVEVADYSLKNPRVSKVWNIYRSNITVDGRDFHVEKFVAFLPRKAKETGPLRPAVLIETADQERHVLLVPNGSMDPVLQRKAIVDQVDERALRLDSLQGTFLPAIRSLQKKINERQRIEKDIRLSSSCTRRISIIIPIYRNVDFIRHQLFAFSSDSFFRENCEIIYVNDDPAYGQDLEVLLEGYRNVVNLDIRLLLLAQNGGYALANNMAAGLAHGETLVLMNSDIVPETPGWLEGLLERLEALPAYSVVGPKLLYADDTLQHAGMYFLRHFSGFWQNMHYYKGYGRSFPPANEERPVGAVTGACMVVRKADFLDVGGFSTDYVIGDYEDSDLCLKLRQKGGLCLYAPGATLYHFERQSMRVNRLRNDSTTSAFNRALHFLKWKDSGLEAGYLQV